ncbi:MAG: hypothetical protein ABII00_01550, partial [Elusimicrobiota bacterium]
LEYVCMNPHPMVAASLLERRFRVGAPPAYYLSIPSPQTSRHRYVRKADVETIRRQTDAWREFSRAITAIVRIDREIEQLLRRIGKGLCRNIDSLRGKKKRKKRG